MMNLKTTAMAATAFSSILLHCAADDAAAPQPALLLRFPGACATAGTGEKKIAVRLTRADALKL